MRRIQQTWLTTLAVNAVLFQLVLSGVGKADEPESIHFFDDYNKAIQEARLTKKPIFLEFRCAP